MKLLDTNVFVYARGRDHLYRDPCRAVLRAAEQFPSEYGIDVETLQELLDVYARRGHRSLAAQLVEEAIVVFPNPLAITRNQLEEAADLVRGYRRLDPRDAIHAAVVTTYELEGIVSTDRAFDNVREVTRYDPLDLAAENDG